MKVLVIGGGASGLTAALTASEDPHSDVHLAERQARVARKLLATGNGRCNLTNRDMDLSHYHGTAPQFCLPALEAFGVEHFIQIFVLLPIAVQYFLVYLPLPFFQLD